VHRDTPVKILHTILLGADKYVWHITNEPWDKKKDTAFARRLQSSSVDGLSIPSGSLRAGYMLQYKKSLIGKHFCILQQLAVFHLRADNCPPAVLKLWMAMGELGALLWFHEIPSDEDGEAKAQHLVSDWRSIHICSLTYRCRTMSKSWLIMCSTAGVRSILLGSL
jgi:hypothetical protein